MDVTTCRDKQSSVLALNGHQPACESTVFNQSTRSCIDGLQVVLRMIIIVYGDLIKTAKLCHR